MRGSKRQKLELADDSLCIFSALKCSTRAETAIIVPQQMAALALRQKSARQDVPAPRRAHVLLARAFGHTTASGPADRKRRSSCLSVALRSLLLLQKFASHPPPRPPIVLAETETRQIAAKPLTRRSPVAPSQIVHC